MGKNPLKEITVLYVEDEAIIRDELVDILEDDVQTLHVAKNGKEGLKLFKEHQVDIVLTDIRMPVMD